MSNHDEIDIDENTSGFLPKVGPNENGISYYLLQPGKKIYHGSGKFRIDTPFMKNAPFFFTTTIEGARKYGAVFEFTIPTGVEYKLVALDDPSTINALYSKAPERIRLILETNYGYKTGRRESSTDKDKEVASYLCQNGYDGYATDKFFINKEN